jgi:hypothetical protein
VAWITHQPDTDGFFQMGVDLGEVEDLWPILSQQETDLTDCSFLLEEEEI